LFTRTCTPIIVFFWKRAQILTAETWAAFSPPSDAEPHPLFPRGIGQLTMFADYRVPQVLHHLRLLTYSPTLVCALKAHEEFASGAREEIAIRAASIIAVERVGAALRADGRAGAVSSVLIDFFLWDLAKSLEVGVDRIEGIKTQLMLPAHRTRSIWY
jgi:Potential Queuosine, Q, salvage protein family